MLRWRLRLLPGLVAPRAVRAARLVPVLLHASFERPTLRTDAPGVSGKVFNIACGASYTLIGAIVLLGGLGYAIDAWRGTSPWCLLGGLLLGVVVGMWELAKTVWHK